MIRQIYTYKNYNKTPTMLNFSVMFNHQLCQIINSLLVHQIHIVQCRRIKSEVKNDITFLHHIIFTWRFYIILPFD